ncbi:hypothetical protein [Bacillus sp. V5-8f]|uniref:hypothetical protein n=1 Tax=Bacillus sp. V5-8f TaxID=2053044 RepID=UPI0021550ECA|nr:hypothetical protein [Bacillus sp. V5-8f]
MSLPLFDKQIGRINRIIRKHTELQEQEFVKELEPVKSVSIKQVAAPKKLNISPVINSPLGEDIHRFIAEFVEKRRSISVLEICKELNSFQHDFKGNFSTGKPKIYPYVTMV